MENSSGKIRLQTIPIQGTGMRVSDPEEARRAIITAIERIPADDLRNFRTGQLTVVK